ncbi:hypothetical protein [Winogradskyella endarachnes]|uniref:Uncharacterized protein n=1 Tax=Winogradskyella endarachnes TaxID=2681965 RepID=A0A6L6UAZ5_9FLAO|nr:hypothetical protein [Winogradskyella endarachnes]MUU78706.1 hypothetical protein [Winogradskyella endarachnes]
MTTLFVLTIFFLGHLCVFFCFKSSIQKQKITNDYLNRKELTKNRISELENTAIDNKRLLLNKNLKQLEFISEFEMYLEDKTLEKCSLEFLQEFNKIKLEAQLSTLKATNLLSSDFRLVA